jgi:hypothetical protein
MFYSLEKLWGDAKFQRIGDDDAPAKKAPLRKKRATARPSAKKKKATPRK